MIRSRVVCGRKFCSRCKCWRHVSDFHARTWEDGEARTLASVCKTCQRLITRERCGYNPRSDTHCRNGHPWTPENTGRRLDDGARWCRACKRERYAQLKRDREWYEQKKEYDRIYLEGRRRRNGAPERNFRNRAARAPERESVKRLAAEPFADWLRRVEPWYDDMQAMADAFGVDESGLRRIKDGARDGVGLDYVDKCLTAAGHPYLLAEFYPELFEEEAAA